MSTWDTYPSDYRFQEVQAILAAVQAGECVSIVGLSGSGKSNLLGFIANRLNKDQPTASRLPTFLLVDCNRLVEFTPQALFRLVSSTLSIKEPAVAGDALAVLEAVLDQKIAEEKQVCLLFDRFDTFMHALVEDKVRLAVAANLRALRDAHKYDLTCVLGTRRPLDPNTELAELFFAHTVWLGPLAENDARWNISRYTQRKGLTWGEEVVQAILKTSWGYPSILRAVCEAYADGNSLEIHHLLEHPAVRKRADEFWADQPSSDNLRLSRLTNHPLLSAARATTAIDTTQLTAKENLLWEYFLGHPEQVCEKDDLIRAVWPEDRIFERGIRDDSLAQLIRRLREKVEPDPGTPLRIHTVPGRGYRFTSVISRQKERIPLNFEYPHRRYNPLTREWVLVSPHRAKRPWQGQVEKMPAANIPSYDPSCYLCPGNQRVSGAQNPAYTSTYVFDNDFQALLRPEQTAEPAQTFPDSALFKAEPDWGICRVGCFSPRHDLSLPELSQPAVEEVVRMWSQETQTLGSLDFINYVQVFENKGAIMGCSNPHPHNQIWSTARIPVEPGKELSAQSEYLHEHASCLLCDYLAQERKCGERIVTANEHFTALVPFWAVWPFEILVIAHRHLGSLPDLTESEVSGLADLLRGVTARYDNLFEVSFPYSMGFHQAPTDGKSYPGWHLHAHYYPPLLRSATVKKFMVGFEMLGMPQRDLTPETAAERLSGLNEIHYKART